jgi:hypothetical protein
MAAAEARDPREKLGALFWVLWVTGFLALMAAFFGVMQWNMAQEHWSSVLAVIVTIVFTIAVWSLAMLPYYLKRRRGVGPKLRPPMRRYMLRFMPAMLLYVVILSLATELFQAEKPTGLLAWLIALAPAIPVLFAIRAIVLLIGEEDDEFQRMLQIKAFVLTTGLMLAICTVWGFLEMFSLVLHAPLWAAFPLWAVCLIPGQLVTRWKWR